MDPRLLEYFWIFLLLMVQVFGDHDTYMRNSIGKIPSFEPKIFDLTKMSHSANLATTNHTILIRRNNPPFLCVTFLNSSIAMSRRILTNNIVASENSCDWVIIIYSGSSNDLSYCKALKSSSKTHLRSRSATTDSRRKLEQFSTSPKFKNIIHCDGTKQERDFGMKVMPKSLLYSELIPFLPYYENTIIMDEDISLEAFSFKEYLTNWKCSFRSSPLPPLISQPLVAGVRQIYPFVNYENWQSFLESYRYKTNTELSFNVHRRNEDITMEHYPDPINDYFDKLPDSVTHSRRALSLSSHQPVCDCPCKRRYFAKPNTILYAVESNFVEQQIPVFHSEFLKWLIEFVMGPARVFFRKTQSSWGIDNIWCSAAYQYAKEILKIDVKDFVPCALIINSPPIFHRDGKTISTKRSNWQKFFKNGEMLLNAYTTLFPTWYLTAVVHEMGVFSPLNVTNNFVRGTNIPQTCATRVAQRFERGKRTQLKFPLRSEYFHSTAQIV